MALKNKNNAQAIFGYVVLFAVAFSLQGLEVFAQTLPSAADSSRMSEDIKLVPTPDVAPAEKAEKPAKIATPEEDLTGTLFLLKEVQIEGLNNIAWQEIYPFYENLIGKKIGLKDIQNIAKVITKYYRSKGYIISKTIIPEQEIDAGGVVKIKVIEGYIQNIFLSGDVPVHNKKLMAYVEKIKNSRPLHIDDLERYTLLINDLPGINAKATISPVEVEKGDNSNHVGASNLTFNFTRKHLSGYVSFNNLGTRYMGPYQYEAGARLNSTQYFSGSTSIRTIAATDYQELQYVEISQVNNIDDEGTTFSFTINKSKSAPGSWLRSLEFENTGYGVSTQLVHPFIRSRSENLRAAVRFDVNTSKITTMNTELSNDRLAVLRVSGSYDFADKNRGINMLHGEISQGLDLFGATQNEPNISRPEGKAVFTKLTANVSRLQNIYQDINLLVAAKGQYSLKPLLSSEEFGFGGSNFGRGLESSEITGDHGFASKLELQYGQELNYSPLKNYLKSYQLYGFYDMGQTWNKDPSARVDEKKRFGSTIGLGARFGFQKNVSGFVEWAKPLTRGRSSQKFDNKVGLILFKLRGEL